MDGYYGMRRKRNIDLSRFYEQVAKSKSTREEEIELEEGYEEYEEEDCELEESLDDKRVMDSYTRSNDEQEEPIMLNGKPFVPKIQPKKQTFSDTHVRVTTYFEKNVHQIVRILQQQSQIESITKFVNDSIKEHLMTKYNDKIDNN